MDVVNAILKPVAETLMVPVTNHLRYMVSCTKYVRDMDLKMKELDAARKSVEEHVNRNKSKYLKIPSEVDGWLKEVEVIKTKVEDNRIDVRGCFNLKIKHKVGREAFKITEEIKSLKTKHELINWTDDKIPLGEVVSMKASTSSHSTHRQDFESRELTFMEALKMLDPSHESRMIALCGMGGVGKTTMMQDLKKVVKEKRMFSFIAEAVIGEKTDPISIQQAVAECFTITLNEETKQKRGERLQKCFEGQSEGGKNKILVILDDVWECVDLNDIGLSPLPNQGVDFKVLLTSRDRDVCTRMGVKTTSIIDVKLLNDPEAQELFLKIVKDSDDADLDQEFHGIGDQIVSKCKGLPIAIKTIACNLRGQSKEAWEDTLYLFNNSCMDIVDQVFQISYSHLKNETQSIFLLCGLYPEDFSIPTEDLVRYGWGLKLFENVHTIKQARNRLNTCIQQLIHANLLIGTHSVGSVKMHDLVRAFVLSIASEGEHASIVNHGSMAEFPSTSESCKRLSLTCKDMSNSHGEYFKYPNLALLKLMHGDNLLRHAQDLYEGMENLQVIAYERTHYLAFSRSLQWSNTLRTLCLEHCSLAFDYSIIGNLLNLEVLSFAHSFIRKLPSIFGKLIKLKILDLTGCDSLRIDSGVLKDLVNLEELYARVRDTGYGGRVTEDREAISFSNDSSNDLVECSKKLSTLEVELFENNAQPMDMSFEKLERFNISLRCFSKNMGENLLPTENKLMLVTSKGELLGSKMNKLFKKTKVLYLQVSDMHDLEEVDVDVISLGPPEQSLFFNVRFLSVSGCTDLRNLFTPRVAEALSMLEDLQISSCLNLETLIHFKNSGSQKISFPKLKHLILRDLTQLSSLCHTSNVIELPQLTKLELYNLPEITDIYHQNESTPSSVSSTISTVQPLLKEEIKMSMLRTIIVESCDSLVNLFPINPMPLISNLEDLQVRCCGSIEALFYIDLGCLVEIEGGRSSLKAIKVSELQKLKEVWRVKGVNNSNLPIHSFQALESLKIEDCRSFRKLFTPTTCGFNLEALASISMVKVGKINGLAAINQQEEHSQVDVPFCWSLCQYSRMITIWGCDALSSLIPYHAVRHMHNLEELEIYECNSMVEVFESQRLPSMIVVPQLGNLNEVTISSCNRLSYLFTFSTLESLKQLRELYIDSCINIQVIVKEEDGVDTSKVVVFPRLESVILNNLPNLEGFFQGMNKFQWHLLEQVKINNCPKMTRFTHGHSTSPMLKYIQIEFGRYSSPERDLNFHIATTLQETPISSPDGLDLCSTLQTLPWSFSSLIEICAPWSGGFRNNYIVPYNELQHLEKLEEIHVSIQNDVEEVFETLKRTNSGSDEPLPPVVINIPNLRELWLYSLPRLERVLKSNQWTVLKFPNLTRLYINNCESLGHVLSCSMVGSLLQLQVLEIGSCSAMKVVLKEEEERDDDKLKQIVFPSLQSLRLDDLSNLEGFCLGGHDFQWPSLHALEIRNCPKLKVFTNGKSTAPKLKVIDTEFGTFDAKEDPNTIISITKARGTLIGESLKPYLLGF